MAKRYAGSTAERVFDIKLAVAAERERCAKIAQGWLDTFGKKNPKHVSAQDWATDAVRDILDNINSPQTE